MSVVDKTMRGITGFLMGVSAVLIAVSTIFATINAIARFFSGGLPWAEELCAYCVVLMVYFSIPFLERRGDQLCISAIDGIIKNPVGQKIINYFRGLVTTAMMVLLSYYGVEVTMKAFSRMQKTYTLQIPKSYLYGAATACLMITVLVWLVIMLLKKGEFSDDN